MHLFSVLLLLGIGTAAQDDGIFPRHTMKVCPGESFSFRRMNVFDGFYFESSTPGSSEIQVANETHVVHPSYQLKNHEIFIPEVMKKHEGQYFWKNPILINMRLEITNLIIKDCSVHKELKYGEDFRLMVPKEASMLEFTPPKSADGWVLWSRINQNNQTGARGTVKRDVWEALRVTYTDAGRYAFLRKSGGEISSTTLVVREKDLYLDGEENSVRFPVPVSEAVLKFIDSSKVKHVLFQNGMETEKSLRIFGNRMVLQAEQGELFFTIADLQSGDTGRYEVYDKNKGLAAVLWISEPSAPVTARHQGAPNYIDRIVVIGGVSVIIIVLVVCCRCVRRPCCKKDGAPVASRGLQHTVYIRDPVSVSGPAYPQQPRPTTYRRVEDFSTPAGRPLDQSRDTDPPTCAEVSGLQPYHPFTPSAPSEVNPSLPFLEQTSAGGGGGGDAPTVPIAPLDPAPQYQFRGCGGDLNDFLTSSPLGTDTATTYSIYNSDKLNF